MRKEKGGKRGRKKMDDREKESQAEERVKVTEELIERREEEEIEERPAIEEAVEQEEERCEEDIECHSSAKRARVCATFTDSQEISIVEFVKLHPELYDKEHPRFHDRNRREALWAEISAELKLQPFNVRHWFESQRDRQPFFDYVASEAEKMTQEEFEELKGKIFRDIETIGSNRRRQPLPRRSVTLTTESQRVGLLPTTTPQASSSTQAAASSSFLYYTASPIGFSNPTSVLTAQDEGSRHNLSGILSQLPDLTSTQIVEQPQQQQQPQQQLFTITTSAPPQQQQQPP